MKRLLLLLIALAWTATAQAATKYLHSSGQNWSTATWYNASGGTTTTSAPGVGDTAETNGFSITLDAAAFPITCDQIQETTSTGGFLTMAVSGTINAKIYSTIASSTLGYLRVSGSTTTATINNTVTSAFNGPTVLGTSCVAINVNVSGGTALMNTSGGRSVSWSGMTGISTITGACVNASGNGSCIQSTAGGSATINVVGDLISTGGGPVVNCGTTITVNLTGRMWQTAYAASLGGIVTGSATLTFNWKNQTSSIDAGKEVLLIGASGQVFDITGLTLSNSGKFCLILKTGSSLTSTSASITNSTSDAQTTFLGASVSVIGPTIPAASDVRSGVSRGYTGYAVGTLSTSALSVSASDVYTGVTVSSGTGTVTGTLGISSSQLVSTATVHGITGNQVVPSADHVYQGTLVGTGLGSLTYPAVQYTLRPSDGGPATYGIGGSALTGTAVLPPPTRVITGYKYGIGGNGSTGTYVPRH